MKPNEGKGLILILLIVLLVVLGFWWLMKAGYKVPYPKQTAGIQNTSDLDAAAKDLDNTDMNQIDTGLNQLNSDASAF